MRRTFIKIIEVDGVNEKKKLFSIIIRGNDKAHWLKILLKRLFSQKEKRFEIIFGNNNCTDETFRITEIL